MNAKIEKLKKPRLYPAPKGTGLTRLIDKLQPIFQNNGSILYVQKFLNLMHFSVFIKLFINYPLTVDY